MIEYFICFVLAFILAFSATPIAKKLAFKVGAIDVPRDERRMHKKPIARLGGLAIVAAFLVSIFFYIITNSFNGGGFLNPDIKFWGFIAGAIIISGLGAVDDTKQLSAKIKLVFQLLAAFLVVFTGTRIEILTNPFSVEGSSELIPLISYPLSILWIVGITNAINLIDGLDGLAAGVSSIASLSLFFVSVISGSLSTAVLTAALAGAALGFLPYNFNPAKIFMGDSGALFLGYTLSVISIQGMLKQYAAIAIAIPLLVLGLPLFDTMFAILRRLMQGKSPMEADRGHLHHRLIDMGLSQKQSVVVMYIASSALGLCAIVLADKGVLSAIILVISISVFVITGARYMSEIDNDGEDDDDDNSPKPDTKGKQKVLVGDTKELDLKKTRN